MTQLTPTALNGLTYDAANVLEGSYVTNPDGSFTFTEATPGSSLNNPVLFGDSTVSFSGGNNAAETTQVTVTISIAGQSTATGTLLGNTANQFLITGTITGLGTGTFLVQNAAFTPNPATGTTYAVQPLGPNNTFSPTPACYAAGTRIATVAGEVNVEALSAGDRVITRDGREVEIIWIGRRVTDCARHPDPAQVWPIRIAAGAFDGVLPRRDLLISPDHAVWVEGGETGALISARDLVNESTVTQEKVASVTYFHVELATHEVILAEGLPAESYLDTGNRAVFANAGIEAMLHPVFGRSGADLRACAPLVTFGPVLEAARARIAAVAATRLQVSAA